MAKGDITLVKCIGSTGTIVRNYHTKEVEPGSYRHTQTVKGKALSWKCGQLVLNGVAKVVEDEVVDKDTKEVTVFYRMEGIADTAEKVTAINSVAEALANVEW